MQSCSSLLMFAAFCPFMDFNKTDNDSCNSDDIYSNEYPYKFHSPSYFFMFDKNMNIRPSSAMTTTAELPTESNTTRFMSMSIIPASITPPKTSFEMSRQYLPISPNIISVRVFSFSMPQIYENSFMS